ncbi:MAG: hypothetical protein AAFQ89_06790 [Cyanobacteria bacterium J06626_18]
MPKASHLFPDDENYIALLNGPKQRIWSSQTKPRSQTWKTAKTNARE